MLLSYSLLRVRVWFYEVVDKKPFLVREMNERGHRYLEWGDSGDLEQLSFNELAILGAPRPPGYVFCLHFIYYVFFFARKY